MRLIANGLGLSAACGRDLLPYVVVRLGFGSSGESYVVRQQQTPTVRPCFRTAAGQQVPRQTELWPSLTAPAGDGYR